MANNYVQMSEQYDLDSTQVEWFKKFIAECTRYAEGEDLDPDSPEGQRFLAMANPNECLEDLDIMGEATLSYFTLDDNSVWFHGDDDEYVDADVVAAILATMLAETNDGRVLTGTCASTCSKPRFGEFGGGWFAVSGKNGVRSGDTWTAAREAAEALNGLATPKETK